MKYKFFKLIVAACILTTAGYTSCGDAKSGASMTLITGADELRFSMSGTGTATIVWGAQKETAELSEDEHTSFILDIPDINSRTVTIYGNIKGIECVWGEITAVDVSRNTSLQKLLISMSPLTGLDVSKNSALTYVDVKANQFSAEALNELFGSLHGNGGTINIAYNPGTDECNKSIAEAKGWKVETTEYGDWDEQTDDAQFGELMPEIFYKLPAALMPNFLKTAEQRREAVTSHLEEYGGNSEMSAFSFYHHHDNGYDQCTIAGYLTDDSQNVLLIVQYGSGLDGFQLKSDKTLNYNIETQEFTEIARPIELPSVDDIILESIFATATLFQRAKTHFGNKMEFNYGNFNKEGFTVIPNYFPFWHNNDDFDFYGAPYMMAWYKWDGRQFYKYKILNYDDFHNEY